MRSPLPKSNQQPRVHQASPRGLRIFCWNAGGLGGGLYPEPLAFLHNSQYDIAVILESKWQENMEFTTGQWSCVHSGCKTRKQAGVLILIHHRIAPPSQLRFEHILQGRLLHIRVPLPGRDSRHVHIIGIYQKAFDSKATTTEQRQQVWTALDRCLARIPARDSLALMGDFNTPLKPQTPHVGDHTNPLPCHPPEDMADLSAMLVTYDLVALNTWSKPIDKKLPSTFKFQDAESQIDFILTRRADATAQARRARAWRSFHVGASRHSGAIHFPLQALLSLRCPHWVRQPPQARPSIDRETLLAALDRPMDPQYLPKIASVRQAMARHMATTSGIQGVSTLHNILFQVCSEIFPAQKQQRALHPWQTPEVQQGIKVMWAQWRAFKKIRKNGLQGWFAAWKAWKSFDRHYRAHQLRCRQARRAKLLRAMDDAQDCAKRHDSRGLYQIVKRIAPKQPYKRLQLRDPKGLMMTPSAEVDMLQSHFRERFQAAPQDPAVTVNLEGPWTLQQPLLLDATILCGAIQAVPRRKAVPAQHPPSAAWRLCADMIAPWICDTLAQAWTMQPITVPPCWSDVDLALILKPDKSGSKPGDYRPIGLSCPLGKKILRCILEPHLDHILQQIRRYPQFAYQQGRSQYDALRKVFTHCASVRTELGKHHKNLHHQHAGSKSTPLFGSLMITVDLSQAFDKMPRELLYQGMVDLNMPTDLITIIMAWHAYIHYTIHHSGESRSFAATQGIRQGCSASPLLWLIFSHAISSRLEGYLTYERLCAMLTSFADDYHMAGTFTTLYEFEQLLSCITALFKVLKAFGMAVSDAKSQAILALRGTQSSTLRRKYVCKGADGPILRIPLLGDNLKIPLVQQFKYLGTQVNYTTFENATLDFRLKKGDAVYRRLGTVLKGKHHLSSMQRLHLWRACIWTTISYGLVACGITPAGHKLLETKIVRQIRAILRLPAHLTFTTNADVMQQAGMQLPGPMLEMLMTREGNRKHQSADVHVCNPPSEWWRTVYESLHAPPESSQLQVMPTHSAPQPCPECGVFYNSRTALLTHIAKCHPEAAAKAPPEPYSRSLDSIGGLPQCSHCKKKFPTWQLLRRHVERNYCHVRHSFLPQPPAVPEQTEQPVQTTTPVFADASIQVLVAKHAANAVFHIPDRHLYRQYCLVCGQWVASSKVMKLHYQHSHPDLYQQHHSKTQALCAKYTGCGTPCLYCSASVAIPRLHKLACTTLWQFCINLSAAHDDGGPRNQGGLREPSTEQPSPLRGSSVRCREPSPGRRTATQGTEARAYVEQAPKTLRQCRLSWLPRSGESERQGQGPQAAAPASGSGSCDGAIDHQTGNTTADPQAEFCVDTVPEAGPLRPSEPPPPDCREVPGGSQNQVHGSPGPSDSTSYTVPGLNGLSTGNQQQLGETADPEGQRLAKLRGQLELSDVGRGAAGVSQRRGENTGGPPGADRQGRSALRNRSGQGCYSQVQCDAFFVASQDGDQHLSSRSGAAGSRSGNCMGHPGDDFGPLGPPGDRTSNPSRGPPPWGPCQRGPATYDSLCRLVLHNPSNQCYLNAFAYMYLWCHCRLEAPEYQLFGTKIQAWRDVLYTTQRPLTISRLPSWRSLLKGWRQPASQHDVADFMMHVLHILDPPQLQATWEARWETEQGIVCQDRGRLSCPIVLPIHATHHTLQDCINDWSLQARLHALASATTVLFIQLARYRCRGTLTFKDRQALAIPAEVTIPIFGKGLRTFKAVYTIVAVIMHHGAHTNTGHYTTILCDGRGKFWETDDGRQAQLSESLPDNACTDGYLFALMRRH